MLITPYILALFIFSLPTFLWLHFIGTNGLRNWLEIYFAFPNWINFILYSEGYFLLILITIVFATPLFQALIEWSWWWKMNHKKAWLLYWGVIGLVIISTLISSLFSQSVQVKIGEWYGYAILFAMLLIVIRRVLYPIFKKSGRENFIMATKLVFKLHTQKIATNIFNKIEKKVDKAHLWDIALWFIEKVAKRKSDTFTKTLYWIGFVISLVWFFLNKTKIIWAIFDIPWLWPAIIGVVGMVILFPKIEKSVTDSLIKIEGTVISLLNP